MAGFNIEKFEDGYSRQVNQPAIIDLVTGEILKFQTIPLDLSVEGESNFADIRISGRNNPIYHFTGSEDILKFNITWYSNHPSREDVIRKCQWLRALSKGDGYNSAPHEIKLVWGSLFKNSKWIVSSAPYRLSLFQRNNNMLPALASQEVTLNKVTEINSLYSDLNNINY